MRHSSASRILYIDGSRDGDELISTLRRAENTAYRVSTATTPGDALELIAAEPFDLFILEPNLPEMSGVELCRRIRQTDKETPILFFTGKTRLADGEVSIAAGATEYLVKPFGAESLLETIKRLLHVRRATKSKNQPACRLAK
jgi:two-component system copper resistance phosphate regulon response regulator CusR